VRIDVEGGGLGLLIRIAWLSFLHW